MRRSKAPASLVIRQPRRNDFKDIVNNYYSYYDEARRNPSLGLALLRKKPSIKEEKRWYRGVLKEMRTGRGLASVAEVDGKVVGFCGAQGNQAQVKSHIGNLGIAIREGYRSRGIGTALLNDVIRKSRGKYRMLILEVYSDNRNAIRLYKKHRFKRYGILPDGLMRGKRRADNILMYRKV